MKQLSNILKTNVRGCKAIGHPFVVQLGRIYLDMLNVYKVLSENISAAVAAAGIVSCLFVSLCACVTVFITLLRVVFTVSRSGSD